MGQVIQNLDKSGRYRYNLSRKDREMLKKVWMLLTIGLLICLMVESAWGVRCKPGGSGRCKRLTTTKPPRGPDTAQDHNKGDKGDLITSHAEAEG